MFSKFWKWIKRNPIDFVTLLLSVGAIVAFVVRLSCEIKSKTSLQVILEMSANYVTVVSCVVVLIQLIAFVGDSRHKEFRCRKEAALDIAQQYVELLTKKISFIQNTLSNHYSLSDRDALSTLVLGVNISSERFTKKSLDAHKELFEYTKVFVGENDVISLELLSRLSIMHDDILNIKEMSTLKEEERKHVANVKFGILMSNTLNTLEYFAMAVNQNVAESEMLFSSLHQTFLKFVHFMYPMICLFNVDDAELFYPNIIKLYRNWHKKETDIETKNQESVKKAQAKRDKSYNVGKPL